MKKILMQKVANSVLEVMGTMFFLTVEEKKSMGQTLSSVFDIQSLRACKITFSGEKSGAIFLMVPKMFLLLMTQNFMGEDNDQMSDELTDGTLKEALNIIAGSALTQLSKESYTGLGLPEMVDSETLALDPDAMIFNTGQGVMASFVQLSD